MEDDFSDSNKFNSKKKNNQYNTSNSPDEFEKLLDVFLRFHQKQNSEWEGNLRITKTINPGGSITVDYIFEGITIGKGQELNNASQKQYKVNENYLSPLKIFIAYNHKDKHVAGQIKSILEMHGIKVLIDSEKMNPGEYIEGFIDRCIKESDITISLVSENSLMSAWVVYECIKTFSAEKIKTHKFIPVAISNSFFEDDFVDISFDSIDTRLHQLNKRIVKRLENQRGIEDIQNEVTRYKQLKINLPQIVGRLKESLTTNLTEENFEIGIQKLLELLKYKETDFFN